jgi:hypothetical protein
MDTGGHKVTPESMEHLQYMDTGKYKAHPESEGAPTWTLVSTLQILKVREHLHGY